MLTHKPYLWLAIIVALLGGANAGAFAQPAPASRVSLTIPQARQVAVNALRERRPELALQIAKGLLQRDVQDSFAYFVIAKASQQLGQLRDGRRAAAHAFAHSKSERDKFSTSQLAARLSYQDKRYTLAQYWLRRSVNHVQTPKHRQQIANDYNRLRTENPWNTQLRFSVTPSSNVNAGSDTNQLIINGEPAFVIINGEPDFGEISRSGQALSGISAVADVTTAYRFSKSDNHAAYLTGRVYARQIRLSPAAARAVTDVPGVPDVRNRDFSATAVELGLRYVFRAKKHGGLSTVRATIGKNWYGGDPFSTFARLGFEHSLRAAKRTRLTFSGSYERRDYEKIGRAPAYISRFSANARHRFEGGSALQLGFFANNTTSTWINTSSKSATAYVSYEMGKPVGPAKFSFGIGATYQDYPNYLAGFTVVLGGRQDSVVFARVSATFDKLDYAGFVPKLTLRAQKNASNVSRFDTTQLSVTLGIQSSF